MNKSKLLLALAILSLVALRTSSQATYSQPRINAAVNDSQLTVLRGNTYPLAQAKYDHGPVAATLPMQNMLLVLKRSPAQEAALESFMAEQQDPSSANYHHWLTPAQFGAMYGPAQQDIDTITKWLGSHGFTVDQVSTGRTTIQFSGNAGQVQGAFHTAIHQYVVNGANHWANSTDPSIPTALVPVVAGVRSLHNFYPKAAVTTTRRAAASRHGNFTFSLGAGNSCDVAGSSEDCFAVGPYDFATIYNVLPLWNNSIDGTGETIAIVADSNINVSDVQQFRTLFGLSQNFTASNILQPNGAVGINGDEVEADLDTEWAGAVAKGATIKLVTSPNGASAGVDLSAQYIIDNSVAPMLSSSFGACEFALGNTGNQFYSNLWQEAAMDGITVLVASGDAGAAACDLPSPDAPTGCGFSSSALLQTAQCGLAVNGIASTQYNVAVGGTDFNDLGTETTYWSTSNNGNQASALKYVPEDVWNDSCTNSVYFNLVSVNPPITTPVGSCSDLTIQDQPEEEGPQIVTVVGSGGGVSNCVNAAASISACSQGNTQPTWQNGLAGVMGNTRNVPDVSLFAGDGLVGHFYIMCEQDSSAASGGQGGEPCTLGSTPVFTGVGGTSASVQAFAGIMAMVDQHAGGAQGNASSVLYPLAAGAGNTCASAANPASTCMFYDVTSGTNSQPCTPSSVDCSTTASLPIAPTDRGPRITVVEIRTLCAIGVGLLLLLGLRRKQQRWVTAAAVCGTAVLLVVSVGCGGGGGNSGGQTGGDQGTPEGVLTGYNAAAGFDLTTGLGSVNADNLVLSTRWAGAPPAGVPTTINRPTLTVPVAALALACALFLSLLFLGLRRGQLRWTTAVLLVAFAFSILSAARAKANTPALRAPAQRPVAVRLASFAGNQR
ncbi:MAG TPA: protease pro-enzyme activation domain-containing protein [Candidatus Baltobacteraceae bacterium]|nr:protease pro-enzyme activation domain-containing protein [Candidatus Baltobacteraceae bacterium]